MVEENVNIVVPGHDPSLSEMICEVADSPEKIAYAKEAGAKGITISVYAVHLMKLQSSWYSDGW